MSEKEQQILDTFKKVLPDLTKEQQAKIEGIAEGIALVAKSSEEKALSEDLERLKTAAGKEAE